MQALHRSEGGWPRAPVLLPFRHKFHDTKGTALAGGCCVQRGWPAVDHWQEPGKAHCRSHSERRFQDDAHAWTAPGQQESASYRRLGEIRPHTVPRPCPSWLHAWMDPGAGLSNLHSCMWQTWPSSQIFRDQPGCNLGICITKPTLSGANRCEVPRAVPPQLQGFPEGVLKIDCEQGSVRRGLNCCFFFFFPLFHFGS